MSFGSFGSRVSHLLFVNDSFVSFKVNIDEGIEVGTTLKEYERVSDQVVNYDKLEICFGRDVEDIGDEAMDVMLGVTKTKCHESYLGIATVVGCKKKDTFEFVRQKVWSKVKSWNGKVFYMAGREILIKGVLQAIPTLWLFSSFQWAL